MVLEANEQTASTMIGAVLISSLHFDHMMEIKSSGTESRKRLIECLHDITFDSMNVSSLTSILCKVCLPKNP